MSAPGKAVKDTWRRENVRFYPRSFTGPQQGPTFSIPNKETHPMRAWDYMAKFLTESILQKIVRETNRYGRSKGIKSNWEHIDVKKFKCFIGIMLYLGIADLPTYRMIWSDELLFGVPQLKNTMTVNDFESILFALHFVNNLEENDSDHENDKLKKVRPLVDHFQKRFRAVYNPSRCLSADEAIVKFKGRVSFKTYNPAKPTKYGYKVWMLCDRNGYVVWFEIYIGKSTEDED